MGGWSPWKDGLKQPGKGVLSIPNGCVTSWENKPSDDSYWSILIHHCRYPDWNGWNFVAAQILKFDMLEYLYRDTGWPWFKVIDAETWTQTDVYQSTTFMLVYEHS